MEINLKNIITSNENSIDCSDGEFNIALPVVSDFGFAYNPALKTVCVIGDDDKYVIGGCDDTDFGLSRGEVMIYSRSDDGESVKATIKLCNDGRIIFNGGFTVNADGTV